MLYVVVTYLETEVLFINQVLNLSVVIHVCTQNILNSTSFLEQFSHCSRVLEDIIFGLLHLVESISQVITQTNLDFQATQSSIITIDKKM